MDNSNIILDEEKSSQNPFSQDRITGSYFAKASAVFHIIAIISVFVGAYFAYQINTMLTAAGSPDAERFAEAIYWGILTSQFIFVMMILGVITRHIAFTRYAFRPVYLYKIQFWAAIITIMPAVLLNITIFFHLLTKKEFYED